MSNNKSSENGLGKETLKFSFINENWEKSFESPFEDLEDREI